MAFTLRLTAEAEEELKTLAGYLNEKTNSGAIEYMILNFMRIAETNKKLYSQLSQEQEQHRILKARVANTANALDWFLSQKDNEEATSEYRYFGLK